VHICVVCIIYNILLCCVHVCHGVTVDGMLYMSWHYLHSLCYYKRLWSCSKVTLAMLLQHIWKVWIVMVYS